MASLQYSGHFLSELACMMNNYNAKELQIMVYRKL